MRNTEYMHLHLITLTCIARASHPVIVYCTYSILRSTDASVTAAAAANSQANSFLLQNGTEPTLSYSHKYLSYRFIRARCCVKNANGKTTYYQDVLVQPMYGAIFVHLKNEHWHELTATFIVDGMTLYDAMCIFQQ